VFCAVAAFSKNLNRKNTLQSCRLCVAALGGVFLFQKNVYKSEHAANSLVSCKHTKTKRREL